MRKLTLSVLASATVLLSGCATLDQASSSLSCMLGRVTGAADASCDGAADATTTVAPGQGNRFDKLQAVLDQEIQQARSTQVQAVSAMQGLPPQQRAMAGAVKLLDIDIADSQSGSSRKMRTLDSVTVDMPLAGKGRPEYTQAMDTLKGLANRLADNRGAASIVVEQSDADIKARRVNTNTGVTQTSHGKPVTVQKKVDPRLPAGVERYTIRAGEIRGQL